MRGAMAAGAQSPPVLHPGSQAYGPLLRTHPSRPQVDVEFGFAPITPKGSLGVRDGGDGGAVAAAAAAAAAAAVVFSVPPSARPQGGSRCAWSVSVGKPLPGGLIVHERLSLSADICTVLAATLCDLQPLGAPSCHACRLAAACIKRPQPYAANAAAAAVLAAPSVLDVSHATRCSSGGEPAGSSRSKRRKGNLPERSRIS